MPKNKHQKRTEADERSAHRAKMSHKDQIARLDSLFGKDLGATKERARLKNLIENARNPKKEAQESSSTEKPKKKRKNEASGQPVSGT